ncbi:MAG: hypothetical protein Q4F24_12625 [Eubacteriales bacterium]|nr:hypothetical protein [Eubacteriales bacterium]
MKKELKVRILSSVFYGIFFGVVLTIVGSILNNGRIVCENFPMQFISSTVISTFMGMLIPGGMISSVITEKITKPGTVLYKAIFNSILMVIILLYMCPLMTIFYGCVIGGASIAAVLPGMFSMAPAFWVVCVLLLMIVGDSIMNLAIRIAIGKM